MKKTEKEQNPDKIESRHLLSLEEDQLNVLNKMNDELHKLTSYKFTLYRGLIRGVGTAIGATVIAAILLWILSSVISTAEDLPIIGDLIEGLRDIRETQEEISPN